MARVAPPRDSRSTRHFHRAAAVESLSVGSGPLVQQHAVLVAIVVLCDDVSTLDHLCRNAPVPIRQPRDGILELDTAERHDEVEDVPALVAGVALPHLFGWIDPQRWPPVMMPGTADL